MKTVVIGAGAMGGLFGGLLASSFLSSDDELWLVDVWKEQVDAIRARGLAIEEQGRERTISVHATTNAATAGKADLVILFVKAYHTEKAVSDALVLEKDNTVFITLQNGLGNEEVICRQVHPGKVLLGVTNQAATLLGPGRIRHAGQGKTFIGELDGRTTVRVQEIAGRFQKAGIETEISLNIQKLVWEKLLINVGINPLAAVTGLKNGQLLDHPETLMLMEALIMEAMEVARRKGILLEGDPVGKVKAVAEATRLNRCSMGQDLDHKRRTEIDVMNGAIVREAERLGMTVPYNRMVTNLVRVIEKTY